MSRASARNQAKLKKKENKTASSEWRRRMGGVPTDSRGANAAYTSDKIKKNRISSEGKAKATASNLASRTKPTKPVVTKPTKPVVTKPTKPVATKPKNAGAGKGTTRHKPAEKVPAKPTKASQRLADTMSGKRGLAAKGSHIKSDRLRDALKSVKKYTPKK